MAAQHLPLDSRWEKLYVAAILETDDERLPQRIRAAEEAISMRLKTLPHKESRLAEIQKIENALKGLNTLRRERLQRG